MYKSFHALHLPQYLSSGTARVGRFPSGHFPPAQTPAVSISTCTLEGPAKPLTESRFQGSTEASSTRIADQTFCTFRFEAFITQS
jgi:hypothetical protein